MRHPGLTIRMAVAGSILFAFYALLVLVFQAFMTLPVVVLLTLVFVGFQYKFGKWMAIRSVRARDLPEDQYGWIHHRAERLSREMGIDKPRLMIAEMGVPNAFAVGRRGSGTVVFSSSLIEMLDEDELEGVLAHECAHILNRDVIVMVLGQSIASLIGLTVLFATAIGRRNIFAAIAGYFLSILAQMVVMVFVLAISRYREYVADSDAARYTNNPEALGRALVKIGAIGHHAQAPDVDSTVGALCIFGGKRGLLASIFATHPPIEKRIGRLAPRLLQEGQMERVVDRMVADLEGAGGRSPR